MSPIAVLGAGSWGTALAVHLGRAGHTIRLWARDAALVEQMAASRTNPRYLPDAQLPTGVTPVSSLGEALDRAAFVIVADVEAKARPPELLLDTCGRGLAGRCREHRRGQPARDFGREARAGQYDDRET